MNFSKNLKLFLSTIIRDLFLLAFILFIIFSFLEILKPRIILNYLNLDFYLFILILLGVITIFFHPQEEKKAKELKLLEYTTIVLLSVLVGILIFYLTRGIGVLSILIGIVSAVICYLFIILNLRSEI